MSQSRKIREAGDHAILYREIVPCDNNPTGRIILRSLVLRGQASSCWRYTCVGYLFLYVYEVNTFEALDLGGYLATRFRGRTFFGNRDVGDTRRSQPMMPMVEGSRNCGGHTKSNECGVWAELKVSNV